MSWITAFPPKCYRATLCEVHALTRPRGWCVRGDDLEHVAHAVSSLGRLGRSGVRDGGIVDALHEGGAPARGVLHVQLPGVRVTVENGPWPGVDRRHGARGCPNANDEQAENFLHRSAFSLFFLSGSFPSYSIRCRKTSGKSAPPAALHFRTSILQPWRMLRGTPAAICCSDRVSACLLPQPGCFHGSREASEA